MRKVGLILIAIVALSVFSCSKGKPKAEAQTAAQTPAPFVVDLKTLPFTINEKALTKNYDYFLIPLPEFAGVDFSKYRRVTVHMKFFDDKKVEQDPSWQSNAIITLVYDPVGAEDKDFRVGPNVPLRENNGGMIGGDASISTDGGSVVRFNKAPGGIVLQNTGIDVKYIQLTNLVFHNGEYKSE